MQITHWILLAGGLGLLVWSVTRWQRSPAWHPEYGARRDVMLLSVLLLAGVGGDVVRGQFREGTPGFLVSSLLLIPVAIAALVIMFRMVKAYRLSQQGRAESGDVEPRPRSSRE